MGLAVSFGIIRRHEGSIEVDSEPGRGTTFKISLPKVLALVAKAEGTTAPEVTANAATNPSLSPSIVSRKLEPPTAWMRSVWWE